MKELSLIDLKPNIEKIAYPIPDLIISLYEHEITLQEYKKIIFGYKLDNSTELLGIKLNKELIGLIGLTIYQSNGFIKHFGILSEYQRQSIGTKIIKSLPIKYNLKSLEVMANDQSVQFYIKLGFLVLDIKDNPSPTPKYLCTLKF